MKAVGEVEVLDKRTRDEIFLAWEPLWAVVHYIVAEDEERRVASDEWITATEY